MLKKIQAEVEKWALYNFGEQAPERPFMGIVEELGELAHARLKTQQGIRVEEDHEKAEKDALGDMLIYMLHYSGLRQFDLEEILEGTWQEVSKRDWVKFPANGLSS